MTRIRCVPVLVTIAVLCGAGRGADYSWNNPAGGNWGAAANWSPAGVPGSADNAFLNALAGPYTVQLTDSRNITNLTIGSSAATLTVTSNLAVGSAGTLAVTAGTLNLNGGLFALNGTMTTGAGAAANWAGAVLTGGGTLAGSLTVTNGGLVFGTALQNAGTLAWTAGTVLSDDNGGTGPSALTNVAAGVIDFRADGTAFANSNFSGVVSPGTVVNQGTLRKSAGAGATAVGWAVDLRGGGVIDAQNGTLNFVGGGTLNNGTTTVTGAGTAALAGGTFTVPSRATFTAAGSGGANLKWTGGNLTAGAGGGTLAGTLVVSGAGVSVSGTTLQNGGTLTWAAGTITSNSNNSGTPVALTNLAAGVIDFKADGTAFAVGNFSGVITPGTVVNQGTLRKSGGATTATAVGWAVDLRHGGVIDAQTGTLNFVGGGILNNGTTTVTGAGLAALSGGTFTVPSGATFTAAPTGASSLRWAGAVLTGGGTLAGSLTVSGGGSVFGTDLKNAGTLSWVAGTVLSNDNGGPNPSALTNLPGGVIDFQADGVAFDNSNFSGVISHGTLVNQGTLVKSAGAATTVRWAVTNTGVIRVESGVLDLNGTAANAGVVTTADGKSVAGAITSGANGSVQGPAGGTATYTGLLTFNAGSTLAPGGGQAGAVNANGGLAMTSGSTLSVRLAGGVPVTGYGRVSVTGSVALNNATLTADTTGFAPAGSDRLFILVNDGTDAIAGTFAGMPDGSTVTVGGFSATIGYFGDSATNALTGGNDVVLYNFTPVPEPTAAMLAAAVFSSFVAAGYRSAAGLRARSRIGGRPDLAEPDSVTRGTRLP